MHHRMHHSATMKVRIPLPGGQFLDADMTPEELATYTKEMAAAPRQAPTPPKAAASTPVKKQEEPDDLTLPDEVAIKEYIAARPGFEHSVLGVMQHFGVSIPSLIEEA